MVFSILLRRGLAMAAVALFVCAPRAFASDGPTDNTPATRDEVNALKAEVAELREQLKAMRELLQANAARMQPPPPEAAAVTATTTTSPIAPEAQAPPVDTRVAALPKSQGGDISGAGTLLRSDRLTIGGYGDLQFRERGINEKIEGGTTSSFTSPRVVLGIAAVLSERQNIYFNSEIEYEFGGAEVEVEQAFVEWRFRAELAVRGGIFTPEIGRFNVYHDSNLNPTAIRPLINQYIVPTAYSDTGLGLRGRFKLPAGMRFSYEADIVNGLGGADATVTAPDTETQLKRLVARSEEGEGEDAESGTGFAPFSRNIGQAETAGGLALADNNNSKTFIGRVALAPISGLEFGASFYGGRTNDIGDPERTLKMFFLDGSLNRGALTINGEYARTSYTGVGIPRQSPAPPVFDPNDEESLEELAEFVNQPTPGSDGFYIEGLYRFVPAVFRDTFDDGAYIAPVFRVEGLRMDRTLSNFYLNRTRFTAGVNFAPSSTIIFKVNYLWNHTLGEVPQPDFDDPEFVFEPFPNYGKSGFAGSITYVF
ncbi:MAG TPA: hypothetical protein PLF26_12145 [Blastocatellia bacterium]|nr:hypothetical protein [Blastocatellia bacterium]